MLMNFQLDVITVVGETQNPQRISFYTDTGETKIVIEDPLVGKELVFKVNYYRRSEGVEEGKQFREFLNYTYTLHFKVLELSIKEARVRIWTTDIEVNADNPEIEENVKSSLKASEKGERSLPINAVGTYIRDIINEIKNLERSLGVYIPISISVDVFKDIPIINVTAKGKGSFLYRGAPGNYSIDFKGYYDLLFSTPIYMISHLRINVEGGQQGIKGHLELKTSTKLIKGYEHISLNLKAKYLTIKLTNNSICHMILISRNTMLKSIEKKESTLTIVASGEGIGSLTIITPININIKSIKIDGEETVFQTTEIMNKFIFISVPAISMSAHTIMIEFDRNIMDVKIEEKSLFKAISEKKEIQPTITTRETPTEELNTTTEEVTAATEKVKELLPPLDMKIILMIASLILAVLIVVLIKRR